MVIIEGIKMRSAWHVFILFILLAAIFNYPLFERLPYLAGGDWGRYFLPWHKITRDSILKDHMFPLWQHGPSMSGNGWPHFHNPETSVITPFILPDLLFGEVAGIKISWTLHLAFGMLGVFLVSRYFNGKGIFNLFPPIVFMLSGHFVFHFTAGHSTWEALSWFPLSFYFFLKSREKKIYIIYSAVFIALILYEGGHHFIIWTFLFFGVYTAVDVVQNRKLDYTTSLFLILALTIGLTASKLLPMFELFHEYKSKTHRGYELMDLIYALFGRDQSIFTKRAYYGGLWWWEFGTYTGVLPFLLGVIGLVTSHRFLRGYLPLTLTGLFFLILSVDLPHPADLWDVLQKVPVLNSQRVPSRFIILFIFVLSIMSGLGLRYISGLKIMQGKGSNLFPLIVILIVYIDLIYVNTPVYRPALVEKPVIDVRYSPSAYLKYGGDVEIREFLPHRITFHVRTEGDNLLVLNRSYWPSWKTTEGKMIEYLEHEYAGGQMAAVLGGWNGPEDREITFYYSPGSFRAGIVLSLLTLALCLVAVWRGFKGSRI